MQAIAEAVALGEKVWSRSQSFARRAVPDRSRRSRACRKTAGSEDGDYSPQFPLRLMNKDFGLILNLAAAIGAEMPATRAAFEVNAAQSAQGQEQDFSAVILEMEKQAHLGSGDNGRTRVGIASAEK